MEEPKAVAAVTGTQLTVYCNAKRRDHHHDWHIYVFRGTADGMRLSISGGRHNEGRASTLRRVLPLRDVFPRTGVRPDSGVFYLG